MGAHPDRKKNKRDYDNRTRRAKSTNFPHIFKFSRKDDFFSFRSACLSTFGAGILETFTYRLASCGAVWASGRKHPKIMWVFRGGFSLASPEVKRGKGWGRPRWHFFVWRKKVIHVQMGFCSNFNIRKKCFFLFSSLTIFKCFL